MKKIIVCPGCQAKLKVELKADRDLTVSCPACQKRLMIRAARKVQEDEAVDDESEGESYNDFLGGSGSLDSEFQTDGDFDDAEESHEPAFEDQWDEFGNAIDHSKKRAKPSTVDEKSSGMLFIRTPLMERNDYKGAGDTIKNPVMRGLYAVSQTLFANVYMGFATVVAATLLVIVLPLWSLNKQWRTDAGVESGDEIRMLQTLGNAKTVIEAGQEIHDGTYNPDSLKDDVESIKEMNRGAAKAKELYPDGRPR